MCLVIICEKIRGGGGGKREEGWLLLLLQFMDGIFYNTRHRHRHDMK